MLLFHHLKLTNKLQEMKTNYPASEKSTKNNYKWWKTIIPSPVKKLTNKFRDENKNDSITWNQ
jgi:hypothetical protein